MRLLLERREAPRTPGKWVSIVREKGDVSLAFLYEAVADLTQLAGNIWKDRNTCHGRHSNDGRDSMYSSRYLNQDHPECNPVAGRERYEPFCSVPETALAVMTQRAGSRPRCAMRCGFRFSKGGSQRSSGVFKDGKISFIVSIPLEINLSRNRSGFIWC